MTISKQPSLKEVISFHVLQKLVDLSTSESDTASVRAAEKLITLLEKDLLPNVQVTAIKGLQVDLKAFKGVASLSNPKVKTQAVFSATPIKQ
ncbi:hypothetical protein C0W42_11290 [Photobacterium kishitanii]|uniref:hypothetical protein n=1 Tax=Photobacterium kishitanii TaxID=318456 RepID=UPI000D15DC41|nr:hypothetical protein [Photobacterium kishitanii]PSU88914.1 hypothetical protein C0W42_11290 [Photobacterium kishitanii]